jgi:hypothetical protein
MEASPIVAPEPPEPPSPPPPPSSSLPHATNAPTAREEMKSKDVRGAIFLILELDI